MNNPSTSYFDNRSLPLLKEELENARILVVGGSKGIGYGISQVLIKDVKPKQVVTVGRTDMNKEWKELWENYYSPTEEKERNLDSPQHVIADLSSIEGCKELVEKKLKKLTESKKFTHVIFTVGAWPDWNNPLNKDGHDRVIHLDVIARGIIIMQLVKFKLIDEHGTIMSVLASARDTSMGKIIGLNGLTTEEMMRLVARKDNNTKVTGSAESTSATVAAAAVSDSILRKSSDIDDGINNNRDKEETSTNSNTISGYSYSYLNIGKPLMVSGISNDIFLNMFAKHVPTMTFIGTFPGIVESDVASPTLGKYVAPMLFNLFPGVQSVYDSGFRHLNMLVRGKLLKRLYSKGIRGSSIRLKKKSRSILMFEEPDYNDKRFDPFTSTEDDEDREEHEFESKTIADEEPEVKKRNKISKIAKLQSYNKGKEQSNNVIYFDHEMVVRKGIEDLRNLRYGSWLLDYIHSLAQGYEIPHVENIIAQSLAKGVPKKELPKEKETEEVQQYD